MEPDFGQKSKEWKYIMDMMTSVMGDQWNIDVLGEIVEKKRVEYDSVGDFQFNNEEQKARLVFGDEDENPIIVELDLTDPEATGLAVITAFTKSILK